MHKVPRAAYAAQGKAYAGFPAFGYTCPLSPHICPLSPHNRSFAETLLDFILRQVYTYS